MLRLVKSAGVENNYAGGGKESDSTALPIGRGGSRWCSGAFALPSPVCFASRETPRALRSDAK